MQGLIRRFPPIKSIKKLAEELEVKAAQAEAAVQLIDEGNTIPFIARYRKEATGSLNDEVLRKLYERLNYLRNLEERKEQVRTSIQEQGKWTEELAGFWSVRRHWWRWRIFIVPTGRNGEPGLSIAKEKGLEPLALLIRLQKTERPWRKRQRPGFRKKKGCIRRKKPWPEPEISWQNRFPMRLSYRTEIRRRTLREGLVLSEAKDEKAESVYEMYYHFQEPASKIAGHRVLAINRGEKEKYLTVKIQAPEEEILRYLEKKIILRENPHTTIFLQNVIADSYRRLIAPAIEREIRSSLRKKRRTERSWSFEKISSSC